MMKASITLPLMLALLVASIFPSLALTDYQRGVLDGLDRGWAMAQKYDLAKTGDPTAFNQAVPDYNAWIEAIFGQNESLMLKTYAASANAQTYFVSRTFAPIHSIDSSWNQSRQYSLPDPDSSGLIGGYAPETYYSIGPALSSF